MSPATGSTRGIAEELRADWPMIASVSLRPCTGRDGFEATFRLDPIVVKGSLEQQGYPRTSEAATKIEARRRAALEQCIRRVNTRLASDRRIKSFSVMHGESVKWTSPETS